MIYDYVNTDTAEFQLLNRRKYIVYARVSISGLVTMATPENFQSSLLPVVDRMLAHFS